LRQGPMHCKCFFAVPVNLVEEMKG
jgi:hypothetical protein